MQGAGGDPEETAEVVRDSTEGERGGQTEGEVFRLRECRAVR